jgi:class 3 adenylate cyclase
LKFVGDGVLAAFQTGAAAPGSALAAAQAALARSEDSGLMRPDGAPDCGRGSRFMSGTYAYGNVGAGGRRDFTAIGRDVNLLSRIAGLCGPLGQACSRPQPSRPN